jgi:hypothetical protein
VHLSDSKFVSVYNIFSRVLDVFRLKLAWVETAKNSQSGLKSALGAISFFTPLFFYTTIVGLYFQRKNGFFRLWLIWFLVIVCLSFVFGWYFTFAGTIKRMLFAVPFFILPTIRWIENLKFKSLNFLFAFLILLFQFFIGLNIITSRTAYGPNLSTNNFNRRVADKIVRDKYFLTFNSGFAFPTEEGVRPILGFVYSFNDWNKFYSTQNNDYENILKNANFSTIVDSKNLLFDYLLLKNDFVKLRFYKISINSVVWDIQVFKNSQNKKKFIISIAGGAREWRRDLNVVNIGGKRKLEGAKIKDLKL